MAYNETPFLPKEAMLNIIVFLARIALALFLVKWIAKTILGLNAMIQYWIAIRQERKLNQNPETA